MNSIPTFFTEPTTGCAVKLRLTRQVLLVAIGATLGWCLMVLESVATPGFAATPDQARPVAPGQARVWFVRPFLGGDVMDAPMIYANGAAIAISPEGTAFYRDFAPGIYVFDVENCLPQAQSSFTLTLTPNDQVTLEVQSDANDDGYDCSLGGVSFLRPPGAAELAELFAPLTYLGAK